MLPDGKVLPRFIYPCTVISLNADIAREKPRERDVCVKFVFRFVNYFRYFIPSLLLLLFSTNYASTMKKFRVCGYVSPVSSVRDAGIQNFQSNEYE